MYIRVYRNVVVVVVAVILAISSCIRNLFALQIYFGDFLCVCVCMVVLSVCRSLSVPHSEQQSGR